MTDAFLATVESVVDPLQFLYKVTPKIIENDGTTHPVITVRAAKGVTPSPQDVVLILTTRNNLDNKPVQRYFEASEACGRIIAVIQSVASGLVLTGPYNFIGDVTIKGDLSLQTNPDTGSTGSLLAAGNVIIGGEAVVGGDVSVAGNLEVTENCTVSGILTVGGVVVNGHTHYNNVPVPGPTGPMI